jgi:diaminopimelate epimerase
LLDPPPVEQNHRSKQMTPRFTKFHGFGNDYLVIESDQLTGIEDLGTFARHICERHYGAGADGIAVVAREQTEVADFLVRIFNPDGSEANLSGNGTRCAAAFLLYQQLWNSNELRLNTRSGIKRYFLRQDLGNGKYLFDSELGEPRFDSSSVPILTETPLDRVVDYPLRVDGQVHRITALQMGNPNCCLFVEGFAAIDWRAIGKQIENHPQFPDRTNVVFVRVIDSETLELRIWERGVGETTASGTCSCAGAIAAMIRNDVKHTVRVLMPGGEARIQWREDGQVVITGTAEVVYNAYWLA